ncbi:hypothetical protein DVH24_042837 [Malus domestica]|uniref:Uncharacterized protein n=1 Tax=Malus domestica TaxID=3750 RepID=A0A498KQ85_MALDO|nr:hypothetical protein DVH24_042837 [Malus domestica]
MEGLLHSLRQLPFQTVAPPPTPPSSTGSSRRTRTSPGGAPISLADQNPPPQFTCSLPHSQSFHQSFELHLQHQEIRDPLRSVNGFALLRELHVRESVIREFVIKFDAHVVEILFAPWVILGFLSPEDLVVDYGAKFVGANVVEYKICLHKF